MSTVRTNPDLKVLGPEPTPLTVDATSIASVTVALSWYSYTSDPKTGSKWIVQYMKNNKFTSEQIKLFQDSNPSMFMCSVARMLNNGVKLPKPMVESFRSKLTGLIKPRLVVDNTKKITKNHDKYNHVIADIDEFLDIFYSSNYKTIPDVSGYKPPVGTTKQDIQEALQTYKQLRDEVENSKEGYGHLKPRHKKAYLSLLDQVLVLLEKPRSLPKKVRKPRAKKVKSATQLTSKTKYQKQDKELKLTSVTPDKIVGATIVWLYDTRYKKLTKLVGETQGCLTVKGTTVLGFGEESMCRRLRKPGTILPVLLKAGKREEKKVLATIKTRPVVPKGRMGATTIILKVQK